VSGIAVQNTKRRPRPAKRVVAALGALVTLTALGAGISVWRDLTAFEASMRKVYALPVPLVSRSAEPDVLAHGKQLAESVASCTAAACHGVDLAGGRTFNIGPLATISGPNISGVALASYTDGELARLIQRGVKRNGRGVLFMPVQNFSWLPAEDISAIVSYLRTVPSVQRPNGPLTATLLGKVLDRHERVILDVARRVESEPAPFSIQASRSANYGALLSRACSMCHGQHLSGGAIPGAPSSIPVPSNLTSDASGLQDWTFDDFERLLTTRRRKNGKALDPFMPTDAFAKYDSVQMHALWSYLRSIPPRRLGQR
jgi:mono/diheme cytochrome c family protein